jgi:hypothetical protein
MKIVFYASYLLALAATITIATPEPFTVAGSPKVLEVQNSKLGRTRAPHESNQTSPKLTESSDL